MRKILQRNSIQSKRWLVHLALIATAVFSLWFEPNQQLHILLGLIFSGFVGGHLLQRKKITAVLTKQFLRVQKWKNRESRLALSDFILAFLTSGMLVTGFLDWGLGHPTKIRWHAIFGVLLAVQLVIHSFRRRKRLRVSQIH